ncbi:MAG: hypothetical protein WD772_00775 [Pseudohongiellaceae bacterium]
MELNAQLDKFGSVPFNHGALLALLEDYRRPNDKIAHMIAKGEIVQLRRGLYVLGQSRRRVPVSLPLIANLLFGPSCVSLDFAMSWHGLIPEKVVEITSVTPRRATRYDTSLGRFSYTHLPLNLYRIGLRMEKNPDGSTFLMAGPEKALCDKLASTRNLPVNSITSMQTFLLNDLRIEEESLTRMDKAIFFEYMACGYKKRQLTLLFKALEKIQCQ